MIVSTAPDSVEKPVRGARKPAEFIQKPVDFFVELFSRIKNSWFVSKLPTIAVGIIFIAMFVAFVAQTCAHLPLLFDGAHYVIRMIERGAPCTPYLRLSLAAFHYPVILAAFSTGQVAPAAAVYSALFSSGPILAVALSWFFIRSAKPGLLVWPMISIGLLNIFAQSFRMGENLFVCEMAWPLLLAVMVPLTPLRAVSLVALALFLAFLHPVVLAFLAIIAVVAIVLAFVNRKNGNEMPGRRADRKLLLAVACGLIAVVAIRVLMATLNPNAYEAREMQPTRLLAYLRFIMTVPMAPISAVLTILSGFLLLVSSRARNLMVVRSSLVASCVLILISGGLAVFWSSFFVLWTQSWFYLRFLFLLLLPMLGFAIVDSFSSPKLNISRSLISMTCGIFFAVTACIHWNVLWGYDEELKADMNASKESAMDMRDYSWGKLSPFSHWGMPSYSIIFQGRKPEKIVFLPSQLPDAREKGIIRLAPWDPPTDAKWFQLPDTRRTSKNPDTRVPTHAGRSQFQTDPFR